MKTDQFALKRTVGIKRREMTGQHVMANSRCGRCVGVHVCVGGCGCVGGCELWGKAGHVRIQRGKQGMKVENEGTKQRMMSKETEKDSI